MVSAKDAREWAVNGGLHGIGESLYTPFNGPDGEEIDLDSYRWLVRYNVDDLERPMLWTASGLGEWWALTIDERKTLLEVAIEEGRRINPDLVIQANTQAASPKDTVDMTLHAQEVGADIAFIQIPPVEVMGAEGVKSFFRYVAARTDIALGIFNSPSSGFVLSGKDMAELHHEIPAVVALKEGCMDSVSRTLECKALAPDMQIWEADAVAAAAGWVRDGIIPKSVFGYTGYLLESEERPYHTTYLNLIWDNKLEEAATYARTSGMAELAAMTRYMNYSPARPDYLFHWSSAFKCMAECLGLPVGDYPHGRAPQLPVSDEIRAEIRSGYEKAGLLGAVKPSETRAGGAKVAG